VDDKSQGPAGLQHVEDRLGYPSLICPVEGLAERDKPIRSWSDSRQIFGQSLNPVDVGYAELVRCHSSLREHVGVGVETDCAFEERGETDREDSGAAARIQETSAPVEIAFFGEDPLEIRGVGRAAGSVVCSRTEIYGRVVRHHTSIGGIRVAHHLWLCG
jgi:hypothetical protein